MQVSRFSTSETVVVVERRLSLPAAAWLFAAAMALSTAAAVFGGLVLGILAATQSGLGHDRWTEAVQAHGRLQLFGWVAVFVAALLFEFLVRFNGRAALPTARRAAALSLLAGGGVAGAVGQAWHGQVGFLWPLGTGATALGAVVVAWLTLAVRPPRPLSVDFQPALFAAAAVWLVVAAAVELLAAARADGSVANLQEARLAAEIMLRGFVLLAIVGVAVRAFPGHLGLPSMPQSRLRALWAVANASLLAWGIGSGAFFLPDAPLLRRVADVALAADLAWLTFALGIPAAIQGPRDHDRHRLFIPLAWAGAVAYALVLAVSALLPGYADRGLYEEGAVRHIFLLGFMAPLMVAMARIVLARFALGRLLTPRALTLGFVLLMVSWPLRVVPVLFRDAPGDAAQGILGFAGLLAMAGLGALAFAAVRTAIAMRRVMVRA